MKDKIPVDVMEIARALGAKVVLKAFDGEDDLSGMLFQDNNQIIIGVNANHHPNRRRFTVAHEIGHLVLHKHIFEGRVHVDKAFEVKMFRDGRSKQGKDFIEIQANRFAAELLMPTESLKRELKDKYVDVENDDEVKALANKYEVSAHAMSIKLFNTASDLFETQESLPL